MDAWADRARKLAASLVALCLLTLGCAFTGTASRGPVHFDYFRRPDASDPWSPKIAGWQARERAAGDAAAVEAPADVSGSGGATAPADDGDDLRAKYLAFRHEHKRALARDVARWIQEEARTHYRPDGPIDHWATLKETLDHNGDDCDGLELLVYHFLRDLGFDEHEVYRAVVVRPSDGQHHMVTLWFERPDDPWVIDPTGAMTSGMPRMSELPDWQPIKVFSETEEFTARPWQTAAQ